MGWFLNLNVKTKMILSFMLVIALMAALAVFSVISLRNVENSFLYVIAHPIEGRTYLLSFDTTMRDYRRMVTSMIAYAPARDYAAIDSFYQDSIEAYNSGSQLLNDFEAIIKDDANLTAAEKNDIAGQTNEIRGIFTQYKNSVCEPVAAAARAGSYTEALEFVTVGAAVTNDLLTASDRLIDAMNHIEDDEVTNTSNAAVQTIWILAAIAVAAALIAVVIALYVAGTISKPLAVLTGFMKRAGSTGDVSLSSGETADIERLSKMKDEIGQTVEGCAAFVRHVVDVAKDLEVIAGGDLTVDVEQLSEKDAMALSLKYMVDNLNNMFGEINSSTEQVSTGSKQIADGAQALAQGSTQQAASVEQLSASISEIAHKTRDNAELAGRAAALAGTIKSNAEKGSRQMNEMMEAVKDINQASQNINRVIKVIDDIAFQTNILALNAAVEAARAGQHGKGFAVVAEEVRNLAAKSAEAAKDTGGLIANSMEKAELGSRIANETAASLAEIVSGINESSQIVNEIAQSSDEQSAGIAQINKGIDQVAQVVQQNSATAEQSAAASEEMSGQSAMLEELISKFRLKGVTRRAASLPPALNRRLKMPDKAYMPPPDGAGDFGKY